MNRQRITENNLVMGALILAGGIAALMFTAVLPLYQAAHHATSVWVSFKGIAVSAMLASVGLSMVVLGKHAIPMEKPKSASLTPLQKMQVGFVVVSALGIAIAVWSALRGYGYGF